VCPCTTANSNAALRVFARSWHRITARRQESERERARKRERERARRDRQRQRETERDRERQRETERERMCVYMRARVADTVAINSLELGAKGDEVLNHL